MQYDLALELSDHLIIIVFIIIFTLPSNVLTHFAWSDINSWYPFKSGGEYKRFLTNMFVINVLCSIALQGFIYCLVSWFYTDNKHFEKRIKEPKHLIIKDRIVPVTDTLIVIGDKKLGKIDTVQIEDFYKYKEYKNEQ